MTEHSPASVRASNAAAEPWRFLARALVESHAGQPFARVRRVLERLLDSSGADRAFIVRAVDGAGATPCVEALASRRGDGAERPSRTVARLALRRGSAVSCSDLTTDPALPREASVRGLSLRSFLAAPLARERVLLLDSRRPLRLDAREAETLIEAYAALAMLVLPDRASSPRSPVPPPAAKAPVPCVAGTSPAMRRTLQWIRRVAASELPVLIRGETGAGKEVAAREVHRGSSRSAGPFMALNCTAFTESLLDAELFGAVRGAYTGAERDRQGLFRQAAGGTLFLDEVGDMPHAMQARLLRAIQERRVRPVGGDRELAVDVRVVSATHRDLRAEIEAGRFRQDLYFRLAVVEVTVPPLRERLDDLPRLVEQLGPRLARDTGRGLPRLDTCAWGALLAHRWPGNVRELYSVLARAMLRAGSLIRAADLDLALAQPMPAPHAATSGLPLERTMIDQALRESRGQISGAARRIGWSRQKLYRRMQALGLRDRRPDQ